MSDFTFDDKNPLARCRGETERASRALREYAELGGTRSLHALLDSYRDKPLSTAPTHQFHTLKRWWARFGWEDRITRWEVLQREAKATLWAERRQRVCEDDFAMATQLRELLKQCITALKAESGADPRNLTGVTQLAKVTSEMQRSAIASSPHSTAQATSEEPAKRTPVVQILPDDRFAQAEEEDGGDEEG